MEINDKNFEDKVLNSNKPVIVMFWGSWCPACKATQQMLKSFEKSPLFNIFTINIDKNPLSQSKYEIASTPTFILFKKGKVVDMTFGAQSMSQLKRFIGMDV